MYLLPIVTTSFKVLGPKMGLRFLILLVVGLGALYTIHLLAQDFMKFTNKTGAALTSASSFFGKRDVSNIDQTFNRTAEEIDFEHKIEWNKILSRDPFNCALSLVCQLSAGAERSNEEANRIYEFISHTIEHTKVPKKLKKSFEQGLVYNKNEKGDFKKCYKDYPICPYSAETMLKLITFNKFVFG